MHRNTHITYVRKLCRNIHISHVRNMRRNMHISHVRNMRRNTRITHVRNMYKKSNIISNNETSTNIKYRSFFAIGVAFKGIYRFQNRDYL